MKPTAITAVRAVLGGLFVASGWEKVHYPFLFAKALADYRILPARSVTLVAVTLPWLEILVGLCLLTGFLIRSAAVLEVVLSSGFAFAVGSAVVRGKVVPCGCFVSLGWEVSPLHLALDLVLVGLGVLAYLTADRGLGIDGWTRKADE
ncbi:MAG: MauE/DoxX family redox-associated membrane protein [Vulcanimicrobiota bacterium]